MSFQELSEKDQELVRIAATCATYRTMGDRAPDSMEGLRSTQTYKDQVERFSNEIDSLNRVGLDQLQKELDAVQTGRASSSSRSR